MTTTAFSLRPIWVALVISLTVLSGCGWFGNRSANTDAEVPPDVNPLIPVENDRLSFREAPVDNSVRITTIDKLTVERTVSGAIVLVTGIASRQGAYGAALRNPGGEPTVENGVLVLEFVVNYPEFQTPVGSPASREVNVAASLTTQTLQQVRAIRVVGLENSREARRR